MKITAYFSTCVAALVLLWAAPAYAPPSKDCSPWPHCRDGGDDPGGSGDNIDLLFEVRDGPQGAGLLTIHRDTGVFDYTTRNDAAGCPDDLENVEWSVSSVRTDSRNQSTYVANGSDLIIDLLAASVGLDGCFGATESDNGQLTLEPRTVGKGRNKQCEAQITWEFDYTSATDYRSLRSDDWIELTTSPFDQCDHKGLQSSILIDGDFLSFEHTETGATQTGGPLTLAFYIVFNSPSS